MWGNSKRANIYIIRVPGREEKDSEIEKVFEKIMKNNDSSNLANLQIEEVKESPSRVNPRKSLVRYIKIKLLKAKKEKNLESSEREAIHCLYYQFEYLYL